MSIENYYYYNKAAKVRGEKNEYIVPKREYLNTVGDLNSLLHDVQGKVSKSCISGKLNF